MTWMMEQCTFSKFADDSDSYFRGLSCHPEGLQQTREMGLWESYEARKKCKVLNMKRNNLIHQYMMGAPQLESSWQKMT